MTREDWLTKAVAALGPVFAAAGATIPDNLKVSCGFPGTGRAAKSSRRTTIGECWAPEVAGGYWQIFVSPVIDEPVAVLGSLVHELIHSCVGLKCGHRGAFKSLFVKLGMAGKATECTPGPELRDELEQIVAFLGEYPHAEIDFTKRKKQKTRMIKLVCPTCGYTVRTTQKWVDQGMPWCPGKEEMVIA